MKVRDYFSVAPRVRTRLPATRCRALGEPDDSRIAKQRLHGGLGLPTAFDREFGLHGSYARRRPTRWLALRSDNRNPRRNLRTDAVGEICSLRNFGSVSVAKEYVQAASPSFAAIERDPQRMTLIIKLSPEKPFTNALTSILSPLAGRGGGALGMTSYDPHPGCRRLTLAMNPGALPQANMTERLWR
jgi:hypothetical protein